MIKINYFFVIATAQLLSENEVPKFTGAEVKLLRVVQTQAILFLNQYRKESDPT